MLYYSKATIDELGYHNGKRITIRLFKKTKNKLTKSEIKKESGLKEKEYKKAIKCFGINFHSTKEIVNKGKGNLIADFMLIPAHGNDFIYPYNPIYDYSKNCYHNCLVIMFLCFEIKDEMYPIFFDYWISDIYTDENEKYLTKDDIFIKSIELLLSKGLNIENILFDSAFFHKKILEKLSDFKINLVTRCPKSRVLESKIGREKAKDIFSKSYNGDFYYYHKYKSFLNTKEVKVFNLSGKIVGIANNKECLLEKKLYFLFTTNLEITSAKILQLYKRRWKIESFFKLLKSYLSMSFFYRNDYDYVNLRINLALAGFIIIQDISKKLKCSFYQSLKSFQDNKYHNLFFDSFNELSYLFINTFEHS